ncbi:MAG TPA: formate hydrogenlyase [Pseudoduganella sp.]
MWRVIRIIGRDGLASAPPPADLAAQEVQRLGRELQAIMGRALAIRHVDAGSCNGCELEIHALNNPLYNLEGAGIRFVASPRHADLLLVTGPVTLHMEEALRRTYEAMPEPRLVLATGDCGCDGGIFADSYAVRGGVAAVLPVDALLPGCPPTPLELLRAILALARPL